MLFAWISRCLDIKVSGLKSRSTLIEPYFLFCFLA